MGRLFVWGIMATALAVGACTQLPFLSSGAPSQGQPAATKTPPPNREPIIRSLTAHRFVTASQSVTLWVQAFDPDCDPMKVSWSVTEGMLSSTVGTDVTLTPTATKSTSYISTVQVSVSDGRGGTAQGSLSVQIGADGVPMMATEATASPPTPEPCSTPSPEPMVTSQPSPTPEPTATLIPYQPDGQTFFLDELPDRIVVNPGHLNITSAITKVRFKALRGAWRVNPTNNVVAGSALSNNIAVGYPRLGWESEITYPTWQVFDSGLPSALRVMTFDIYRVVFAPNGNPMDEVGPLKVYVSK